MPSPEQLFNKQIDINNRFQFLTSAKYRVLFLKGSVFFFRHFLSCWTPDYQTDMQKFKPWKPGTFLINGMLTHENLADLIDFDWLIDIDWLNLILIDNQ